LLQALAASFAASFIALIKIVLVIAVSAWLVRRGVFGEIHIRALTGVVVNLALPCLMFSNILANFDARSYPYWWKFPLIGTGFTFTMLAIARIFFWRDRERGFTLSALATFQNAGYLILPIGEALFPEQFGRFSVILFLMLLSFMPLLWSLAKFLVSHMKGTQLQITQVFTPPFYAAVLAMTCVFTGIGGHIPAPALGSVDLVGKACVPLATVVLGLTMGSLKVDRLPKAFDILRVIGIKLLLAPALMFLALKYLSFSSGHLENAFWILEASSPPATALALQAIHYGGDEKLVCGILVVAYLAALVTIPFFFSLVEVLL
jgi:predicted permease